MEGFFFPSITGLELFPSVPEFMLILEKEEEEEEGMLCGKSKSCRVGEMTRSRCCWLVEVEKPRDEEAAKLDEEDE